jgi:hypothetical protein
MAGRPGIRLRIALTALGYLAAAWWLVPYLREPPRRWLDRLLTFDAFHVEHVVTPVVATVVLGGVPLAAAWLSRPTSRRRRRAAPALLRPPQKIALLLAFLFALWLVAEMALRVADRVNGRSDATTVYGPGPDAAHFHRWLQEAPVPGELQVNRERFRGPEIAETKPPGAWRLFTLGGPSTFLADLPYEETYSFLLGQRLAQARPDRKVEVYNAAYRHWTSQHSLIWYVSRIQDFDPDALVQMEGPMDLACGFYNPAASRRPFERSYSHYYGPLAFAAKARLVPQAEAGLLDHSRVFWYMRRGLRFALYGEAPPGADDLRTWPADPPPPGPYPSLWCYERNVRTLAALAGLHGRRLVLLTHPYQAVSGAGGESAIEARFGRLHDFDTGRPVNAAAFDAGLRAFNDATRRLAHEVNAPLVDLDRALSGRPECFSDPWTLNARGCAAAAPLIADVVLPLIPATSATRSHA